LTMRSLIRQSIGKGAALLLTVALASVATLASSAADAQQSSTGWWVIVGSHPTTDAAMTRDYSQVAETLRPCGLRAFNDVSEKFLGFRGGYNVFVLGAYPARAEAEAVAVAARRCVPDAYVKYGQYLGE
jgi:hypothetical protein